ncbi:MAG: hypothetical protein ACM3JI_03950 [Anaerolineae bacterium]
MKKARQPLILLLFVFLLNLFILVKVDRFFWKHNDGFSIRMMMADLPYDEKWQTCAIPLKEKSFIETLFKQPFHYLNKGHQTYVFESQDGQYVLKFYRFPSHLRPFSWLNHPFSYRFSEKRRKIKAYNLEKLSSSFHSYQLAFEKLRQESGLLFVHLNLKTNHFKQSLTLVDRLKQSYIVDPNDYIFILQKKASLLFPTLKKGLEEKDDRLIQSIVSGLFELIEASYKKEIVNLDPILEKNYGWLEGKVIYLDVGRFSNFNERTDSSVKQGAAKITEPLKSWLQNNAPEFLQTYQKELERF